MDPVVDIAKPYFVAVKHNFVEAYDQFLAFHSHIDTLAALRAVAYWQSLSRMRDYVLGTKVLAHETMVSAHGKSVSAL